MVKPYPPVPQPPAVVPERDDPPRGSRVRIDMGDDRARMACREALGRDLTRGMTVPPEQVVIEGELLGSDLNGLADVLLPGFGRAHVPFSSITPTTNRS